MSSESWSADIPPMPSLEVVAEGGFADGAHWEIRAGGNRENYLTLLEVTLADGRKTGGGGHGGPILLPGRHMSFSVHRRDDPAIQYLVGRVHSRVERLHLTFAGPPSAGLDVHPTGELEDLGVAFVAEVLPPAADLVDVVAWDDVGNRIDERSARHHGMLGGENFPRGSNDGHISWTPPDRR